MKRFRKLISAILCVVLLFSMGIQFSRNTVHAQVTTADSWIDPGNYTKAWVNTATAQDIYGNYGTVDNPYEIKSAKDLAAFSYYSNTANITFEGKYIKVTASEIDLAEHYWYPIGATAAFRGIFDGNNCMIKNVYIGKESNYSTIASNGLFSQSYGNISNVHIDNFIYYTNSTNVGALIGSWNGGNIKNCFSNGEIYNIHTQCTIGGLIGAHTAGEQSIENCETNISIKSYVDAHATNRSRLGGLIGYINAKINVLSCRAAGQITAGSNYEVGGFVGWIAVASTINKSSANVQIISENNCCVGGFLGKHAVAITITDCFATGNISASNTSYVGGFYGLSSSASGTYKNCYAKGEVLGGVNTHIGGFAGRNYNDTITQCGALGNVTVTTGCAGGFLGSFYSAKVYNSYCTGNVTAENNSNVGGFSGYNEATSTIENCYATGSTKAGPNSKMGGFSGSCNWNATTFKRCYWNKSAKQTLNAVVLTEGSKIGVGYGTFTTVEGATEDYMRTTDFVVDMNEYVEQSTLDLDKWESNSSYNNGYPYITTLKVLFLDITSGSEQISIYETEDSKDKEMNVYGTFVYPEIPVSEEPVVTPDPEENAIHISLEWGSLEYQYTSGDYNEEDQTYADGIWEAKEAGVTDLIRVVNKSESDIKANFTYIASTESDGNFQNIQGQFEDYELGQEVSEAVTVSAKENDIELSKTIRFGLTGAPVERVDNGTPEVIGKIVLTLSKYVQPVPEPVVSEDPAVSEEPVVSAVPEASEEPVVSAVPEASEEPVVSAVPEASTEPVVSAVPEASTEAVATEIPETSEVPETSNEPTASEEPVVSETTTTTEE